MSKWINTVDTTLNLDIAFSSHPFLFQVQSDHSEEFFAPKLDKYGYEALFNWKNAKIV